MKNIFHTLVLIAVTTQCHAQVPARLSFSLLSPVAYGQTSIAFEKAGKGHFSYGISVGYHRQLMNASDVHFSDPAHLGPRSHDQVLGYFAALNIRTYLFKPIKDKLVNIFATVNMIANSTEIIYLRNSEPQTPHHFSMHGATIGLGLCHKIANSFGMEYGFTLPAITANIPSKDNALATNYYPGLGRTSAWHDNLLNSYKQPSYFINLIIKLN